MIIIESSNFLLPVSWRSDTSTIAYYNPILKTILPANNCDKDFKKLKEGLLDDNYCIERSYNQYYVYIIVWHKQIRYICKTKQ